MRCRALLLVLSLVGVVVMAALPASATPEFARRYQAGCNTCHTVVPRLNVRGLDFLARGYRPAPELKRERHDTVPLSVWLGGRFDDQIANRRNDVYLNKVEILAGDSVGSNMSYFVEWRVFDLEAQSNGTLRDRSGRFEDAWLSWQLSNRLTFTIGQYRPMGQLEPGRKLSISTPAVFDTSVEGTGRNARLRGLAAFSLNTRSPGLTFNYQSMGGRGGPAMDGLFHSVTLPFVGELSLPLNQNARRNASFELEARTKGVFLETYYRKGYNSIGINSFIDGNRYQLNTVGTYNTGDLFLTAGVGFSKNDNKIGRLATSLELEYLPTLKDDAWRPGIGLRVDNVSHSGRKPAFVPYLALATPNNKSFTSLLQLEYFGQSQHERFRIDFSAMF